ncbi:MAG: hypothetical protein H6732_10790 [Alphaproteobacteria bacterium]|nr:hypothetical protein [Alphaproteobacteria bacterium]
MLVGIAISRVTALDATWTTVHVARALLARGHQVRFIETWDFEVDARGQLTARTHAIDPPEIGADAIVRRLHRRQAARRYLRVDTLDLLLLRASPLEAGLLAFAAMAQDRGVPVVNPPAAMTQVSHKAWLAGLKDVPTPQTLVTRSPGSGLLFYEKLRRPVIVKPARGSGGHMVQLVRRRDPQGFATAFQEAGMRSEHVVVQAYLEEATEGEKRLVWMDGDVLGAYLRRRAEGEFRHNLSQGGTPEPTVVTDAEKAVVARLSPHLRRAGIRIAGLDLIGQHVVEVNAVNPGGAFYADLLHGTDVAGSIVERLEAGIAQQRSRGDAWERHVP